MTTKGYHRYRGRNTRGKVALVIVLVLVHHAVFFSLEALSWAHIVRTIVRTVASGAVSVAFIWVIARIFTAKLPVRI